MVMETQVKNTGSPQRPCVAQLRAFEEDGDGIRMNETTVQQSRSMGYKRTEVGVIPKEWKVNSLRSCLSSAVSYGINAAAVPFDDRLPTYLRITDIDDNHRFRPSPQVSVKHPNVHEFYLKKGDLVFARTGASVGNSYLYDPKDGPLVFAGYLIRVTPSPSKLHPLFLRYCVQSKRYWDWVKKMSIRSGQPGINGKEYGMLIVPLPPLREQRAIAEVLSEVDELLSALEELIAKKQAVRQAAMQQLLTGKTRLPGFSGKWETKRLGEIGDISGAGVDKKVSINEVPVRLVNYLDAYHKTFLYSEDLTHEVSAKSDQVRRCMIEKGDIFFTPSSEVPDDIGRSAVAMEDIPDGVYSYHIVRLRLKTDWDLYFRAYAFDTKDFFDQASTQCEGSGTRYVINLPKFRAMTVCFPPNVEEQAAIANILSDMDAEIAALEQRRDTTRAIKQGMMQELLTGKVRLV